MLAEPPIEKKQGGVWNHFPSGSGQVDVLAKYGQGAWVLTALDEPLVGWEAWVPTALDATLVGWMLGMPFRERSDLDETKDECGSHDRLGPASLKYAFSSRIQCPIGRM
jgi:hypothetical protein